MKAKFEFAKQLDTSHVSLCKYSALRNLPHWHKEHELIIMIKGSGTLRVDNCSFALCEGNAALIGTECIHDIACSDDSVIEIIKFSLPSSGDSFVYALPTEPIVTDNAILEIIRNTVEAVRTELESKPPYYQSAVTCRLEMLIISIARTGPSLLNRKNQTASSEQAQKLLSMIEREYATVTFDAAAHSVGFSRTYFSEYFKEICGMTFTSYLNLIRVGEAVRMLRDEKRTATETALSCGFGCIRSFNRVFKKLTGYAPTSLPEDYSFVSRSHQDDGLGFDPTLPPTVLLSDLR